MLEHLVRGFIGIVAILGIAFLLSSGKRQISWRIVVGGLGLQLLLAVLILQTQFSSVIGWISSGFVRLISFTEAGSRFLFGDLVDAGKYGFAFSVLPTIIFVSALTSVLYYLGILQRVVWGFAWVMKRAMNLSGAESLATAANVFVGQTEAPLVVKPYIAGMSRSEIMALMTGGMATIAGTVFAFYVTLLAGDDAVRQSEVARMLLTASMMNAPAALIIAKLMVPETHEIDRELLIPKDRHGDNLLDALANGTIEGLKLTLNVAAMLLVFVALIAMLNFGLGWIGGLGEGTINSWIAQISDNTFDTLSLEAFAGFLFAPIAWLVGAESGDLLQFGQLLGSKVVTNEFIAYSQMGNMIEAGTLGPKSIFLATFALCGFANFSSIGIQLGGIGGLCPEQRPALAALGMKALIGGTLASLLTASIAGMFFAG